MKKILLTLTVLAAFSSLSHATISISGTGILNAEGLQDVGDTYTFVANSSGGAFDTSNLLSLDAGLSLANGNTLNGYYTFASGTLQGTPTFQVANGLSGIPLVAPVGQGDTFGIIVFDNSSASTLAGDTFYVFHDTSWVLPPDGSDVAFGGTGIYAQLTSGGVAGTVVPEPSSFALLAGVFGLAWVMVRRRA